MCIYIYILVECLCRPVCATYSSIFVPIILRSLIIVSACYVRNFSCKIVQMLGFDVCACKKLPASGHKFPDGDS